MWIILRKLKTNITLLSSKLNDIIIQYETTETKIMQNNVTPNTIADKPENAAKNAIKETTKATADNVKDKYIPSPDNGYIPGAIQEDARDQMIG